jgi:colanic acid/amylovoran biosynthesis glycosyltransferase
VKKVCFKIGEFPNVSETFIVNQIQYAIDLGHDTSVLVGRLNKEKFSFFNSFFSSNNLKIKKINYNIHRIKTIRLFRWFCLIIGNISKLKEIYDFHKYSKSFSLSHLFVWYFYRELVEKNDIIHVQFGTKAYPLAFFKKYYKFKLIVSFHGHDAFFPIGHIKQKGYYNLLFKTADIINTNTKYLTNQLIKIGCPENIIEEIPVAVDVKKFKNDKEIENTKRLKLLNVGRLHPVKGQKYLIELMSKIKESNLDICLTIVGEGELKEEYNQMIIEKSLDSYVNLVGSKNEMELIEIYKNHDVFLFSSVPFKKREETQGLVCLEAQSCGLPIIAFDSGGVKYTFNSKSGFLCNVYDIDEMYKKIYFFYENRHKVLEKGNEGSKFVEEFFSVSVIKNKWKKIYK